MKSILCRLGSHDWKYSTEKPIVAKTYRTCQRCGLTQKLVVSEKKCIIVWRCA